MPSGKAGIEAITQADAATRGRSLPARCGGFTYVSLMLALALLSLGLSVAGPQWAQQAQRERERELMRIGALYAEALGQFRDQSPGSSKQFPLRLEYLLADPRFVGTRRHLRKLYADPVSFGHPWGLIRDAEGGIIGVYSSSDQSPLAAGAQILGKLKLPVAKKYSDWKFMAAGTQ